MKESWHNAYIQVNSVLPVFMPCFNIMICSHDLPLCSYLSYSTPLNKAVRVLMPIGLWPTCIKLNPSWKAEISNSAWIKPWKAGGLNFLVGKKRRGGGGDSTQGGLQNFGHEWGGPPCIPSVGNSASNI